MSGPAQQPSFYAPNWSVIRVTGPDAAMLLHNLSTNEVKALEVGAARETLFTDLKAHVLAHTVLCRGAEAFDVVVTSPEAPALAEHLDRHHIREELQISLAHDAKVALAWPGEGNPLPADGAYSLPALGDATLLVTCGELPSGEAISEQAFHNLRIRQRFPLDRVDVDHRNLPQELNRNQALISFEKGCYLGQETVARIDALGRVNQLLVLLQFKETLPTAGESLLAGEKQVGRITSVCHANDQPAWALAYVRRAHAAPGHEVFASKSEARGEVVSP